MFSSLEPCLIFRYYTGQAYDSFSRPWKTHRCWKPKGKENENLTAEWNRFTTINFYNERGALLQVTDTDNHTWWQADESDFDAYGRVTQYQYGNGLSATNIFDPYTGRTTGIEIISSSQFPVSSYQFGYDRLGNLTSLSHERASGTLGETCTYDSLNRLVSTINAATNTTTLYDSLGNITARSDVGTYLYSSSRPHAVTSAGGCDYSYDNNGNILGRERSSVEEFSVEWTSFNKPSRIIADGNESEFEYSVDGRRTKQLIIDGTNITKKVYATPAYEMFEIVTNPSETNRTQWAWEMRHCRIYVDTPAGKVGIYQQEGSTNGTGAVSRSYLHKDHLDSVIAISDDSADLTYYSYDAWGNRRDPDDWSSISTFNASTLSTDRGYTGHEMLDHLDLIHMNGRIYDPVIGRMISPDPLIQKPNNLQSFNRYSYVWNNPLTLTDPSGFITSGFITSGLELVLGSARRAGGDGGGGAVGGGCVTIDNSWSLTTVSHTPIDSEWVITETLTEWMDADGNYYSDVSFDIHETYGGAATSAAVANFTAGYASIGAFSSAMFSYNRSGAGQNGLGTGGGRYNLSSQNPEVTGKTAEGEGKGTTSGKLLKENKKEGSAAKGGANNPTAESGASKKAQGTESKTKNEKYITLPNGERIPMPANVDVKENMKNARWMLPWTFRDAVKKGGKWDYKQKGMQYEAFGNFHYGVVGKANGFFEGTLLREAGRAQQGDGAGTGPGSPGILGVPFDGKAPYADEPKDQHYIKQGFEWYDQNK